MIDRVIASLAAAAVLLVCTASPSAAQIGIEIGATIGYYSPMGSFKADYRVGGATTPDGVRPSVPARVSLGTAQLLYRVNGDESRAPVWLSAGGGAIKHGGAAYDVFHEPVNYGGVAGVGSAVRIRGGLSLDLELSSMSYNIDFRTPGITLGGLKERGTQLDMMLRAGLSYRLH